MTEQSVFWEVVPLDARIFYVFKGNMQIEADGRCYGLQKGDMLLLNAGIHYKLIADGRCVLLAVNLDYTYHNAHVNVPIPPMDAKGYNNPVPCEYFENMPALNRVLLVKELHDAERDLVAAEREFSKKLIGYENVVSGYLAKVIISAVRKISVGESRKPLSDSYVADIISYLNTHFSQELTNRVIGDKFGLHPNYAGSLVKNLTGMPLHKYLIYIRLNRAIALLESTNLSVNEIAEQVGFSNLSHFSKAFKQFTGYSPGVYRKRGTK